MNTTWNTGASCQVVVNAQSKGTLADLGINASDTAGNVIRRVATMFNVKNFSVYVDGRKFFTEQANDPFSASKLEIVAKDARGGGDWTIGPVVPRPSSSNWTNDNDNRCGDFDCEQCYGDGRVAHGPDQDYDWESADAGESYSPNYNALKRATGQKGTTMKLTFNTKELKASIQKTSIDEPLAKFADATKEYEKNLSRFLSIAKSNKDEIAKQLGLDESEKVSDKQLEEYARAVARTFGVQLYKPVKPNTSAAESMVARLDLVTTETIEVDEAHEFLAHL